MREAPRRIPTGSEFAALMEFYGYRFTRTGRVAGSERSRAPDVVSAAAASGWPVGRTESWTPREVIDRAIAAASALEENSVLAATVAGLGSAPRGRQIPISFGWARFLDTAPAGDRGVPDAGLGPDTDGHLELDVTETLLRLALGWSWNEGPLEFLPDLEAAVEEGLPEPTAEDRSRLRALLDLIAAQPAGTTPGALEKAVARAKVVPMADKYQRYGILIGLTEIGVMPSATLPPMWDRFIPAAERRAAPDPGGPRSDIPVPLSGWRGGIDAERAGRLLAL